MLHKDDSTTRRVSQQLPVQLLARILQPLDLKTRLQTCALVCSSWHKAAVLSVRDITVKDCTSQKAAGLSAWLSAHAAEAQVTSIAVTSFLLVDNLVLPVQQLSQLRALKLSEKYGDLKASVVDAHGSAAPLFGSPGGVIGLTRLELYHCPISLQGLQACTALQHLDFRPDYSVPFHPDGIPDVSHLLEALPQLSSSLTFLQLRGPTCPERLMLQLSSLRALWELCLEYVACPPAGFKTLPSGLTSLTVSLSVTVMDEDWEPVFQQWSEFSPSTTPPSVCQLTALQELVLRDTASAVLVTILTDLSRLSRLQLDSTSFDAAANRATHRVLSSLTQLRHLSADTLIKEQDAFDCAAFTASQQLTYLQLPAGIDPDRGAAELFPQGVQLPHLEELVVLFELFCDAPVTNAVKACTALKRLGIEEYYDKDEERYFSEPTHIGGNAVAQLSELSALTSLSMEADTLVIGPQDWGALARLTGLHALSVRTIELDCIDGFGQLTALQQLTKLAYSWCTQDGPVDFEVINNNPAGSPSNVWSQAPAVAPQLLGPCAKAIATVDVKVDENVRQDILMDVLQAFWGALDDTVQQQQQQQQDKQQQQEEQQEVTQLRQRVWALEAQVAGLQDELAAVRR